MTPHHATPRGHDDTGNVECERRTGAASIPTPAAAVIIQIYTGCMSVCIVCVCACICDNGNGTLDSLEQKQQAVGVEKQATDGWAKQLHTVAYPQKQNETTLIPLLPFM